jgi:hypothetical protein
VRRRRGARWKGALAGAVGGAVGTLVMELYWKAVVAAVGSDPRKMRREGPGPLDDIALAGARLRRGESSTEGVARIAAEALTGEAPNKESREKLSQAVHWGYGTMQGALYGAVRGRRRAPDLFGAGVFATALWGFSEVGLPLLGLGKGPSAYPLAHHAATLGAHLAYGAAASTVAQALQR